MRWKLANGGVVASTKQPIKRRDFDRIVIEGYDGSYTTNSGIEEDWGSVWPHPYQTNDPSAAEFTVALYNPSSRTIYKSNCDVPPSIGITNNTRSSRRNASVLTDCQVINVHHGKNVFTVCPRALAFTNSHDWTGWGSAAQYNDGTKKKYGPDMYLNDTYTVLYRASLVYTNRNRRIRSMSLNYFSVTFKVRIN